MPKLSIYINVPIMQVTSSRVPTGKSRGPILKQTYEVWGGSSPIVTFVRCLRLLDLDRLPDWPGITEHTFATGSLKQNLQARVKCVEWSLYRLFELWNLPETRDVGLQTYRVQPKCFADENHRNSALSFLHSRPYSH